MPSLTFPEPALFVANQGEPSLRWGILGPGVIATAFVKAMRGHTRQQPFAVASRSRARAEAFAQAWSIPRAYDSYQALVDAPRSTSSTSPRRTANIWRRACSHCALASMC